MSSRRPRRDLSPELTRLRLLATLAPIGFVVVVLYLMRGPFHRQLHEYPGFLYVLAVVSMAVSAFSFLIFAVIARLERRMHAQNRELAALNEIAKGSAESLDLDVLLDLALARVVRATGGDGGMICLVDEETGRPGRTCVRGSFPADPDAPLRALVPAAGAVAELVEEPVPGAEPAVRTLSTVLRSGGQRFGVLTVAFSQDVPPSTRELLRRVSAQLSLAVRNRLLFADARRRNEELAALLAVGAAASSSLHLAEMLDAALGAILAVSSAEAAEVWLLRDGELVLERRQGADPAGRTRLRVGEGLPGLAVQTGRPVVVHDLGSDPRAVSVPRGGGGFESFCAFPLRRGDEIVGVLGVAAHGRDALSEPAEHRLLEGIGEQVAVALANARLHERVLAEAVLEERERLARELHDGLAQVLAYVNTQTIAIRKLLALGRQEEAQRQVTEMGAAARRVYSDVREAILGLRSSRGALVPSLRAYLAEYERIAGIPLRLEADEEVERLRLLPSTEIQLVRIVQEALANVRKHARAESATVRLGVEDGRLAVEVEDDGRGFDAERPRRRPGWPRFGLQTMRERAAAHGAELELESVPGHGTRVAVTLPLEPVAEKEARRAGAAR